MGKRRFTVMLVVALSATAMMIMAAVAQGVHPRPKGATPIRVSLVPAFTSCTTPNRSHGPPLAFPSCNPPVQTSTAVTVGEITANGAAANAEGYVKLSVIVGVPGPPDDSDVAITSNATDVRCKAGTTACGAGNAADGADYTGEMQGNATIRISDHFNAIAAGGGTDGATVVDIPYPIAAICTSTASTSIGSTCTASTSANAAVPGAVKDGKRAIVEVGQILINDGGPDGIVGTAPNTLFAVQGIFIP